MKIEAEFLLFHSHFNFQSRNVDKYEGLVRKKNETNDETINWNK